MVLRDADGFGDGRNQCALHPDDTSSGIDGSMLSKYFLRIRVQE